MPRFSEFCVCNNLQGLGADGTLVLESRRVTLDEVKARKGWIFEEVGLLCEKGIEEVQDLLLELAYGEAIPDAVYLSNDWTVHGCFCSNPGASCVGCPLHWASASADDEDAISDAVYRREFEERTGIDFAWVLEGKVPKGTDLSSLEPEIEGIEVDPDKYPAVITAQFLGMPKGSLLIDAIRAAEELYHQGSWPFGRQPADPLSIWLKARGKTIPF